MQQVYSSWNFDSNMSNCLDFTMNSIYYSTTLILMASCNMVTAQPNFILVIQNIRELVIIYFKSFHTSYPIRIIKISQWDYQIHYLLKNWRFAKSINSYTVTWKETMALIYMKRTEVIPIIPFLFTNWWRQVISKVETILNS